MQRIRNKSLQLLYINSSKIFWHYFYIMLKNNKLSLYNYFSLEGYKYYLAGRANNVLWVKTRYVKAFSYNESKKTYNSFIIGNNSSNFYTTY